MITRKILGVACLVAPFTFLFGVCAAHVGLWVAAGIFGTLVVLLGCIALGHHLIDSSK